MKLAPLVLLAQRAKPAQPALPALPAQRVKPERLGLLVLPV